MSEVKTYRIVGRMLIGVSSLPQWVKFTKDVRALKVEDAIEKVLSEIGSKHKVKRCNIKIEAIYEIPVEYSREKYLQQSAGVGI